MPATRHPLSYVTVDVAVLTILDGDFCVLLVEREEDPFAGALALPGGFVRLDEDLREAAARLLAEETGVRGVHLEQLKSYGAPARDPRPRRTVSVAHIAAVPMPLAQDAASDALAVWSPVGPILAGDVPLAFDHREIVVDAVERVRAKLEYTTVATEFLADEFTLGDLRHVYEVVWGHPMDPGNFQRKMKTTENVLEETGATRPSPVGRGRPASVFRVRRGRTAPVEVADLSRGGVSRGTMGAWTGTPSSARRSAATSSSPTASVASRS